MGNCYGSLDHGAEHIAEPGEKFFEISTSKNEAITRGDVILQGSKVKEFRFHELQRATGYFHKDGLLGEGGFGPVYQGWVDEHTLAPSDPGSGTVVAVKMLNVDGYQGESNWRAEVNYLGHLDHPNLVKLLGYCAEGKQRLLVYEYMSGGNLEDHLFWVKPGFNPLSWDLRMKVALGAARGLAYLHHPDIKVIHRDFKPSNILLDPGFNAKLSDFGLVVDGPPEGKTHITHSKVYGTCGYVDPTYLGSGRLRTKSDVYSFGVVLLEILTGRVAVDVARPRDERDLVCWAMPYLRNGWPFLTTFMDKRIDGQYSWEEALKVAEVAEHCLSEDLSSRPSMNEVVRALERVQAMKHEEVEDYFSKNEEVEGR